MWFYLEAKFKLDASNYPDYVGYVGILQFGTRVSKPAVKFA